MARSKRFFGTVIALATLLALVLPRDARAQLGQWTSAISEPSGSVTVDPSDPWRLYSVGWSGTVFTSDDAGATWSEMGLPFAASSALAVSSSRLGSLYAFERAANIPLFRSGDNGIGWSPTAFRILPDDAPRTVAVDPRKSSTIYAGTERRLSRSTDGGASWEDLKLRAAETRRIYDILFPPRDPSTIYVLDADYSY
jgi:photosystem II stability/assembly factor-like uncharacterized protein